MFKNILALLIFAVVSITPVSAVAISADNVNVMSVENSMNSDDALLQPIDGSVDRTEIAQIQSQALSADNGESVLSTEWLFAVALFWFVMLSNRRGV
jgi:hypothetical protein